MQLTVGLADVIGRLGFGPHVIRSPDAGQQQIERREDCGTLTGQIGDQRTEFPRGDASELRSHEQVVSVVHHEDKRQRLQRGAAGDGRCRCHRNDHSGPEFAEQVGLNVEQ